MFAGHKPKRSLASVILDNGRAESLRGDVQEFLSSREWYATRGIPFRRGYLLHGPPGTGKTSFVGGIASELGLDIYSLSLSAKGLDDDKLAKLLNALPPKTILLIEDIDAASSNATKRRNAGGDAEAWCRGVTLAGLLNVLDGIDASEGRVLFATTNHRELLDPALCRPGRMDVHFEFSLASKSQAKALFKRFYPLGNGPKKSDSGGRDELSKLATQFVESIPDRTYSMAEIQGYLVQYKTDA
ncbi:P-loop containing nucleoside triphosphate hydrolase protein, partial [Coprinopsis marcescibilis]